MRNFVIPVVSLLSIALIAPAGLADELEPRSPDGDWDWTREVTFTVPADSEYLVTFDHETLTFDVAVTGGSSGDPYVAACVDAADWMNALGAACGPYTDHDANIQYSALVCAPGGPGCAVDALGFFPNSGLFVMLCSSGDAGLADHANLAIVTVGCGAFGFGASATAFTTYDALCFGTVCAHVGASS